METLSALNCFDMLLVRALRRVITRLFILPYWQIVSPPNQLTVLRLMAAFRAWGEADGGIRDAGTEPEVEELRDEEEKNEGDDEGDADADDF